MLVSSTIDNFQLDDDVRAIAQAANRIVIPTDSDDQSLALARRAGLGLAVDHDLDVVLYDRSQETWADTPHPSGPFDVDQIDAAERPHLVRQLEEFGAAGVTATAWLATVPSLSALFDVFNELDADAVVLPETLCRPTISDRLLGRSGPASILEHSAGDQRYGAPPTVLRVDGDRIDLVSTESTGDSTSTS